MNRPRIFFGPSIVRSRLFTNRKFIENRHRMGVIGFQERIFEAVEKSLLLNRIRIAIVGMGFCRATVAVG